MNQDTFLRHFLGIVCVISLYALLLDLRNDTLLPRVGMGFAGLFAATTITFSKSQSSLIRKWAQWVPLVIVLMLSGTFPLWINGCLAAVGISIWGTMTETRTMDGRSEPD